MERQGHQSMRDCVIFGGRSHPDLVKRISENLDIKPATVEAKNFGNGETAINIHESVRDKDVFVVQTSYGNVNDALMELLIIISALKIASAKSVTAVLPLFPYGRQLDAAAAEKKASRHHHEDSPPTHHINQHRDSMRAVSPFLPALNAVTAAHQPHAGSPRKAATFGEEIRHTTRKLSNGQSYSMEVSPSLRLITAEHADDEKSNEPNHEDHVERREFKHGEHCWIAQSGSLVASLLATAGADHVITMDLHDPQYQGFFDVPFDNLVFRPLLLEYIQNVIPTYHSAVIVSPDAGGAKRAAQVADQLQTRFALIHQDRRNNATILVGDVNDRVAILIDDLIDSGKTLLRAGKILKDHGAVKVYAICTHGLFSQETVYKFRDSCIDQVVTTNSVPQEKNQEVLGEKLHVVDISLLFAEAIRRVYNGESISRLYSQAPQAL